MLSLSVFFIVVLGTATKKPAESVHSTLKQYDSLGDSRVTQFRVGSLKYYPFQRQGAQTALSVQPYPLNADQSGLSMRTSRTKHHSLINYTHIQFATILTNNHITPTHPQP